MNQAAAAVISLSKWLNQVGVTPCTAWRWRKKGWLKTVNIAGRQYLTQESIDEFHHRASAGEFAQVLKVLPPRPHKICLSKISKIKKRGSSAKKLRHFLLHFATSNRSPQKHFFNRLKMSFNQYNQ